METNGCEKNKIAKWIMADKVIRRVRRVTQCNGLSSNPIVTNALLDLESAKESFILNEEAYYCTRG